MCRLRDLVDELLHAKVKAKLFGGDHAPQLGRLRLLDRLGAGAMGTVFAAYDPRLDRKVAVKVLRTSEGAARVLAEARALAKLVHPNVVAVHDADELDGLVFIVMELAAGVPLRTWMAGSRDWRDVARVVREAGIGLAAAHAAGLVHRDIKPDNILVGHDRTRVVDFGLANTQADGDGTSAGTPFYMAPEVLAGSAATPASDQFSFGVTMYEALYGKRPYGLHAMVGADTVPVDAFVRTRGELIADLARAASVAASVPRPSGTPVPAWLHAIVTSPPIR
jgi:eukaryotic-like serine/threonine-protein kinase